MRLLSLFALLVLASDASAFGKRTRYSHDQSTSTHSYASPFGSYSSTVTRESVSGNTPLAEVNSARLARGLRPFIEDPNLTVAAQLAAQTRADKLITGHLSNDFACLPPGTSASAAGCGALTPDWGWRTCCTYEHYTYAGAALAWGRDGRRYMHIFVR